MLKKLYVALCCLSATLAFGQRSVSLSATVSPAVVRTNYNRTYLYPDSDGQIVEPVYLSGTVHAPGYQAGLTAQYTYAPGWSVGAGIWYSQATMRQSRTDAVGGGTTDVRSRAIRLPFLLSYQPIPTRRLSPYLSLGLLLDFPFAAQVVVTRPGLPTQRLRLNTDSGPIFQPALGAGGRYELARRCALVVQPMWAYNLGRFGGAKSYNSSFEVSILTQLVYSF